jgi:hypothetical protein
VVEQLIKHVNLVSLVSLDSLVLRRRFAGIVLVSAGLFGCGADTSGGKASDSQARPAQQGQPSQSRS